MTWAIEIFAHVKVFFIEYTYVSSTDIIPVRNIASKVPAPPIETNGTPRSGIFFKLSISMPRMHPNV